MNGSNAKRNQETGLLVLEKALVTSNVFPKRNFLNVKEFEEYFSKDEQLIIDATEQVIQRPFDKENQKESYSGKKKEHN